MVRLNIGKVYLITLCISRHQPFGAGIHLGVAPINGYTSSAFNVIDIYRF